MASHSKRKHAALSYDELQDFKLATQGITPLEQDKIAPYRPKRLKRHKAKQLFDDLASNTENTLSSLSDEFEPQGVDLETGVYIRPGTPTHLTRRLRRQSVFVEAFLDLHGLNSEQAKQYIERFFQQATWQKMRFVSIIHGKGSGTLKDKIYFWLPQHPQVLAFRRADMHRGGDGAVVVLLKYM